MQKLQLKSASLKRVLAMAMVVLMVFSAIPASAFRVFAEDAEATPVTEGAEVWENLENGGGSADLADSSAESEAPDTSTETEEPADVPEEGAETAEPTEDASENEADLQEEDNSPEDPAPGEDVIFVDENGQEGDDPAAETDPVEADPEGGSFMEETEGQMIEILEEEGLLSEEELPEEELLEEPVEELSYPAFYYNDTVNGMDVVIDAPEGAFPEGVTVVVRAVRDRETLSAVKDAVAESMATDDSTNAEVVEIQAFDITFYNADGEEIQPLLPISVSMCPVKEVEEGADIAVVHVDNSGVCTAVEDLDVAGKEASFSADSFSIYAYTTVLVTRVITADGETYDVELSYTKDANLPEGAYLTAEELLPGDKGYEEYYEAATEDTLPEDLIGVRFFDITIHDAEGREIEPDAPVQVKVSYVEPVENADHASFSVFHFTDSGCESIQPAVSIDAHGNADEFSFKADSLSVYAVIAYNVYAYEDLYGEELMLVSTYYDPVTGTNSTRFNGKVLTADSAVSGSLNGLKALDVFVEDHEDGKYVVSNGDAVPTTWIFEAPEEGTGVYIRANGITNDDGEALYLTLHNDTNGGRANLTLETTPFRFSRETQTNQTYANSSTYPGLKGITRLGAYFGDDVTHWFCLSLRYTASGNMLNAGYVSNATAFVSSNIQTEGSNQYGYTRMGLHLVKAEDFEHLSYDTYTATKVSVQDLEDGETYLIYTNFNNETTSQFENWIIDGEGNPVVAYDAGDTITLRSDICPVWQVSFGTNAQGEYTGYYIIQAMQKASDEVGYVIADSTYVLGPDASGTLVRPFESLS
ncbi:MAG: hypothetical protein II418_04750, partial [Firmicutes bacterium]|nr:hypothetical protein [Bacillota bacterium]